MKRFKRFFGLCPQNDSVVKTTSKQQTVTNHSTFQLFNHSTGKTAFTLAEVKGKFPPPGGGLGRGEDLKSSEQILHPSLKFVSSLPCLGFAPRSQNSAFGTSCLSAPSVGYPDSLRSVRPQIRLANKFFSLPRREKRIAFTLAEVLITLAIIGLVAAITLPNVIKNYENQVKLNKLKKFYSQFEQLVMRSVDENDGIMTWSEEDLQNGNSDKILEQYIFPYLDNPKICKSTAGLCNYKNNLVYNKAGQAAFNPISIPLKLVILKDGSSIIFRPNKVNFSAHSESYRYYWTIYYDYNGKKGPNVYGEDIFNFMLYPLAKKFAAEGHYISVISVNLNSDDAVNSSCKNYGNFCAEKIIRDGWKIKY